MGINMNENKILVVDDNEKFLKSVKFVWEERNYKVLTSTNARLAIDILR